MSYFNDDQIDYMNDLRARPLESLCWCAWWPKGQCHSCPPDKSAADKVAEKCPECGCWPISHNSPRNLAHSLNCSRRTP